MTLSTDAIVTTINTTAECVAAESFAFHMIQRAEAAESAGNAFVADLHAAEANRIFALVDAFKAAQ